MKCDLCECSIDMHVVSPAELEFDRVNGTVRDEAHLAVGEAEFEKQRTHPEAFVFEDWGDQGLRGAIVLCLSCFEAAHESKSTQPKR